MGLAESVIIIDRLWMRCNDFRKHERCSVRPIDLIDLFARDYDSINLRQSIREIATQFLLLNIMWNREMT